LTEATNDQTETNRTTIREAFEGWNEGTGAIADVFAPEMVWRIEGHSFVSKTYDNKQQFIDEVLAPFRLLRSGTAAASPRTGSPMRTATRGP
jgi:ketosteroid isomerase-like protein